jgi:hypothetical protein
MFLALSGQVLMASKQHSQQDSGVRIQEAGEPGAGYRGQGEGPILNGEW